MKNIKTDEVVYIFTDSYNFIWQGALPWEYSVSITNTRTTSVVNVNVTIPSLSKLEDDIYSIKIPFSISYMIDKNNPPDKIFFKNRDTLDAYVSGFIEAICSSVLIDYIEPVYNRKSIIKDEKALSEAMVASLREKFKSAGIICDRLEVVSRGSFPDDELYREGIARCRELRDLDFANMKQEIIQKNKLVKEKSEYELYHEKLNRISLLIKDNPDILKYIYIDKMGDDIKVIISSDKTGIPVMLGSSIDEKKSDLKGDIDNLR